jgi:hypothetical protein
MRTSSSTGTAARDLAQVVDRALQLVERTLDERRQPAVARDLGLERPERQERGREALLGAVVQVALEPPALAVARADEPEARRLELLELCDEVAMEPVALHRAAPHRQERGRELGRLEQLRVVHEHPDAPRLVRDGRGDLARVRPRLLRVAADPHVAVPLPVPPVDPHPGVVEDLPERVLHLGRRREIGDRIEDAPNRLEPGRRVRHQGVVVARPHASAKRSTATGAPRGSTPVARDIRPT